MQKTKDISEAIASTLRSYGHVVAADIVIQLEQQRAELLGALKRIIPHAVDGIEQYGGDANNDADVAFAKSVITKAEATK